MWPLLGTTRLTCRGAMAGAAWRPARRGAGLGVQREQGGGGWAATEAPRPPARPCSGCRAAATPPACRGRGPPPLLVLSPRGLGPTAPAPCSRPFTSGAVSLSRQGQEQGQERAWAGRGRRSTLYYLGAAGVLALGLSYAAVPLYRIFCQAYSYGGTTKEGHDAERVGTMKAVQERTVRVRFNADTAASMTWNFRPQQTEIKVHPGETALAFYTARNPTDRPVIGVSTYNVVPFDAGQYFNKIQCFCFEEQQLNPHEEVHMPVFFYIDPEFAEDPKMENVDMLTLSYTFFEAREGLQLPIPQFARL